MDICPTCQTNFDLIHKRCMSVAFGKVLQKQMDNIWIDLGKSNSKVDRLEDQVEALQEENAELRLKKNGVEIDKVKHMLLQGKDVLPSSVGLSDEEAKAYSPTVGERPSQ